MKAAGQLLLGGIIVGGGIILCIQNFIVKSLSYEDLKLIVPAIALVVTALGAYCTFYKWRDDRSREYYLTCLKEVYAPLHGYLIQQEAYREWRKQNRSFMDQKEFPIIEKGYAEKIQIDFNEDMPADSKVEVRVLDEVVDAAIFFEILNNALISGLMSEKLLKCSNEYLYFQKLSKTFYDNDVKLDKWGKNQKLESGRALVDCIESEYKKCMEKINMPI